MLFLTFYKIRRYKMNKEKNIEKSIYKEKSNPHRYDEDYIFSRKSKKNKLKYNRRFWKITDEFVYLLLEKSVDIMPKRLQKLIAHYYTDARIRKLYFERLGVKMGKNTFANLGFKAIVNSDKDFSVFIGDNVSIVPNLTVVTHASAGNGIEINSFDYVKEKLTKDLPVYIEDEAWIGANAVILPGVRIGRCCIIGAGSVVNTDTEPYSIYAGTPARKIRSLKEQS